MMIATAAAINVAVSTVVTALLILSPQSSL
jgi:hypothetical protein